MGLESFKTDKPRTRSKSSKRNSLPGKHSIHVTDDIDLSSVNVPGRIKRHNVQYIEIVPPDEHEDGSVVCACMQCSTVATSYEAIVKSDHLDFQDDLWYDKFKEIALDQAPDKPTDNVQEDEGGNDSSDSGLMAFKS